MDENTHKEEFSYAYVHAVASAAGLSFARADRAEDIDGIDVKIRTVGPKGLKHRPAIDAQVKCTSRNLIKPDSIKYPLEVSAYESLRYEYYIIPRILIVVVVPDSLSEWLYQSEDQLLMRRCGYWFSLEGMPETLNKETITLSIPRRNIFNVDALKGSMNSISIRKLP